MYKHINEVIESMLQRVDDRKRKISHKKCRKPRDITDD